MLPGTPYGGICVTHAAKKTWPCHVFMSPMGCLINHSISIYHMGHAMALATGPPVECPTRPMVPCCAPWASTDIDQGTPHGVFHGVYQLQYSVLLVEYLMSHIIFHWYFDGANVARSIERDAR